MCFTVAGDYLSRFYIAKVKEHTHDSNWKQESKAFPTGVGGQLKIEKSNLFFIYHFEFPILFKVLKKKY